MLLLRKNRLAYRCSWRWRLLYAAACVVAVAAAAGTLGVPPAQAQVLSPAEAEAGVLKKEVASLQDKNDALRKQVEELQVRLKSLEAKAGGATGSRVYPGMYPRTEQAPLKAPELPKPEEPVTAIQLPPDAPWDRVREVVGQLNRLCNTAKITADAEKGVVIVRGGPEGIQALIRILEETQLRPRDSSATMPKSALRAYSEKAPARSAAAEAPVTTAVRPALDTSQLDVVSLANSYSDALEKLEIADSESKSTLEAAKHKAASQHDADLATIRLRAAERRAALLRSIAEHAIRAAKLDVELLQFRVKEAGARAQAGRAEAAEVLELKTRLMRAESQLGMLQGIVAQ